MNSTEKLAMAVPNMRESLQFWCHHIKAIHIVATNEHEDSPALQDVIIHLEDMHVKVKDMCNAYDKLRSLVGTLEREQGIKPKYYVDRCAGKAHKGHCPVLQQHRYEPSLMQKPISQLRHPCIE